MAGQLRRLLRLIGRVFLWWCVFWVWLWLVRFVGCGVYCWASGGPSSQGAGVGCRGAVGWVVGLGGGVGAGSSVAQSAEGAIPGTGLSTTVSQA